MDIESEITRQHQILAYHHEILANISDYQYKRIVDNDLYIVILVVITAVLVFIVAEKMDTLLDEVKRINEEI
tara:strand:+ start:871 stop:1086 length:216 start_codon:yes stop_codon:yes gene_type:complete